MKISKYMFLSILIVAATALSVTSLPLRASDLDDRIESSARASHIFQTYLQDDDINIESKDGIVTLTGTVASESHRTMAQDTVMDLPGVKAVDNKLELKGEPPSPNSDLWILDKVKTTLLFHRSVSGLHTEVDVSGGIVTLRGVASNSAERDLATEYAKDVDGVRGVDNQMTVLAASPAPERTHRTTGTKIDDASITTQVKLALLFHKSTSAIRTEIKTRNGLVTVEGTAHSAAEKHLVTKIAEDVNGVVGVRNDMTIKSDD